MATSSPSSVETRGELVCRFIETFCRAPEGSRVGEPIQLADFQRKFILAIYDNPVGTRRAYLSIGRKNGKTALIACLLLAHLVGPEKRQNSQIISGARSRDQASLVFNLACKMINLNPTLKKIANIVPSSKIIVGLMANTEFRAIAADGSTAQGLSPVLAILDEVGQVRGPSDHFIDAITTAQGAHEDPLLIAISTQAANDADLFSVWLDDARRSEDPHMVCHVYEAPPKCDLMDEAAWLAANPAMDRFRSRKDVQEQALQATRMPTAENTFRNLTLNQRVSLFSPFVSIDVWKSCAGEPDQEEFETGQCYIGVDLSSRLDLTAAVVVVQDSSGRWHVKPYFWCPEDGLFERSTRDRTPYDVWVAQGILKTTPGASVDYEYVARDLSEIAETWDIKRLAFDRWRFDLLKKEFYNLDVTWEMVPFGQGFKDMSPAIDNLESILRNKQLLHGMNPILTMCAANSTIIKDSAGNRKLDKARSTGRIDGMVALTMAIGCSIQTTQDQSCPEIIVL